MAVLHQCRVGDAHPGGGAADLPAVVVGVLAKAIVDLYKFMLTKETQDVEVSMSIYICRYV